jgi:Fe-S-cluster containining protein
MIKLMKEKYKDIENQAKLAYRSNRELINKLKRKPPSDLDERVRELHREVFSRINCLECANCCRTLGPRITDKDISRIAKYLKLRPSDLTEMYLRIDEDGDYVFREMPCPFLRPDNYCNIYEQRPSACRDYPHTDRKRFYQVLDLALKNSFTCPGVLEVLGKIK